MTRSIFDPTGDETEHSGNRYTGPNAAEISQMPPDVTDGRVEADEEEESEELAQRDEEAESPEMPDH